LKIRDFVYPFIILFLIMVGGTIGYIVIEGYTLLQAIYMTVITVTTVGYGEVEPLSPAGKIFTIILLIVSVSTVAYAFSKLARYVVDGEMNLFFKTRKLNTMIGKLEHHVIICGYGRNGEQAAITLRNHGVPYIVVEQKESLIERLLAEDPAALYVNGDATRDEILQKAGVEKARALITCLPVDADNVFIVLTARELNGRIQIISRASYSTSHKKLVSAGANHVIMPDRVGGAHMASLVTKPDVIEFIDYISGQEGEAVNIETIAYEQLPADLRSKQLRDLINWDNSGVNILGFKNAAGKFIINPPDNTPLEPGMKIFALGTRQQVEKLKVEIK
jgi:voltage-gated potassium channel